VVWAVYRLVFRELTPDQYEAGVPEPTWADRQVPILMFGVLMSLGRVDPSVEEGRGGTYCGFSGEFRCARGPGNVPISPLGKVWRSVNTPLRLTRWAQALTRL
jgi:hypothetical protein